ncbi:MAG: exodeoxyribonuclease VII large subunit [Candidatus Andersenbacteria bacterium]
MKHILSVSQLVEVTNMAMGQLGAVAVEGEVSDYRVVHNKWVTFSLKDQESTVPCFMTVWQLRVRIEDGMLVRVIGTPKLRNKGFFSFVVSQVAPAGEGALKRAFELLKEKLEAEGLFAVARKRPLPQFPQRVALITSREAAAYSDFLKVLRERIGGLEIMFLHTQVQGEDAPNQIINALNTANTELTDLDVIILVRGGGSLEDLQAFNDEAVIRAVAASRTPIIVGVGHERDVTLAELAADVRASTPSNAAELLVRSRLEVVSRIEHMQTRLKAAMHQTLSRTEGTIVRQARILQNRVSATSQQVARYVHMLIGTRQRILQETSRYRTEIARTRLTLMRAMHQHTEEKLQSVTAMTRLLQSLSPQRVLARGFSITRKKDGSLVYSRQQVAQGETIVITLKEGQVTSKVV